MKTHRKQQNTQPQNTQPQPPSAATAETPEARVARLYAEAGGPLVGWLLDEARQRRLPFNDLARELGVTYAYINQLRTGLRSTACIGQDFAEACARFLGVPAILVKVLAGRIVMSDFAWPYEGEAGMVERAYRRLLADPVARQHLPAHDETLSLAARRALVLMYAETTGQDVLGVRSMSWVMQYLQRLALVHEDRREPGVPAIEDFAA